MDRRPPKHKILRDAQPIPSFVDQCGNVGGFDGVICPRSSCRIFYPLLELFGSVHYLVVDPFLVLDRLMVGSDQFLSVVEGFNFLWGEFAGEDIEIFTKLARCTSRSLCWPGIGYYSSAAYLHRVHWRLSFSLYTWSRPPRSKPWWYPTGWTFCWISILSRA